MDWAGEEHEWAVLGQGGGREKYGLRNEEAKTLENEIAGPLPRSCQITGKVSKQVCRNIAMETNSNSMFEHRTRCSSFCFSFEKSAHDAASLGAYGHVDGDLFVSWEVLL